MLFDSQKPSRVLLYFIKLRHCFAMYSVTLIPQVIVPVLRSTSKEKELHALPAHRTE